MTEAKPKEEGIEINNYKESIVKKRLGKRMSRH